jgi:hypothetical protein
VSAQRTADRLVCCYPAAWRARYGAEFTQLLADELSEGPMGLSRRLDVILHGLWTRLSYAGLAGTVVTAPGRMRVLLLALGGVLGSFALLAVGLWSQLSVGWQFSAPTTGGTRTAAWLMSAAVIGLGAVLVALVCGTSALFATQLRHGGPRGLWRSALACLGAGVVLYVGCAHFAPHWPGTAGHADRGEQLVPVSVARLGWAATLWISSYWAHPGALGKFPPSEIAWMLISPVAWLVLFIAGAAVLQRLAPPPGLQRAAVRLFSGAVAMMVLFLAGAVAWAGSKNPGPRNLFAGGTIDLVMIAVLGGGLVLATHLIHRTAATSLHPRND